MLPGSVGPGLRLLASMATRNTMRGWAMKRGGSKSTRKRTSFVAAIQAKNEHILSCCTRYTACRGFGLISFAFVELLRFFFCFFLRSDSQQRLRPLQWYVYNYVGLVVAQIWSFEFVRQISTFVSDKFLHLCQTNFYICVEGFSVLKGLNSQEMKLSSAFFFSKKKIVLIQNGFLPWPVPWTLLPRLVWWQECWWSDRPDCS